MTQTTARGHSASPHSGTRLARAPDSKTTGSTPAISNPTDSGLTPPNTGFKPPIPGVQTRLARRQTGKPRRHAAHLGLAPLQLQAPRRLHRAAQAPTRPPGDKPPTATPSNPARPSNRPLPARPRRKASEEGEPGLVSESPPELPSTKIILNGESLGLRA